MRRSFLLRPSLLLVAGLFALSGCASLRMPWHEVSAQKFQQLYDQRKRGDFWTYEGVRHGYASLVHFRMEATTDEIKKVEKVRCPISALPPGFPKHQQRPLN